jgi:hypothetical protein
VRDPRVAIAIREATKTYSIAVAPDALATDLLRDWNMVLVPAMGWGSLVSDP